MNRTFSQFLTSSSSWRADQTTRRRDKSRNRLLRRALAAPRAHPERAWRHRPPEGGGAARLAVELKGQRPIARHRDRTHALEGDAGMAKMAAPVHGGKPAE